MPTITRREGHRDVAVRPARIVGTLTSPYPGYEELQAAAEASIRADGGFVDPAKLRRFEELRRPYDWRVAVLGHDPGLRPSLLDLHMLLIADERDLDPPRPAWLVEQREREAAEREAAKQRRAAVEDARWAEWAALRQAFPVPVAVAYNYSGGHHYAGWSQGARHVIALEELSAGRLHRAARSALCTVPSRQRHQDFPDLDTPDADYPTCRACIRTMCRITGVSAPTLEGHR
jgi:hypothetical protein